MTYWAKQAKKVGFEKVDVLTTTPVEKELEGIDERIVIPANGKSFLSRFIQDEGLKWKSNLKTFIQSHAHKKYDLVVISGGPFMHFGISKLIKKQWGAQVFLDYRDPFAVNPRFHNSKLKIAIKQYFERKFNKKADRVISVNQYCLQLLSGYEHKPSKFSVIPNGYDETEINDLPALTLKNPAKLNLLYAGTIFPDRNPEGMLEAVNAFHGEVKIHHVGKEDELLQGENVEQYGLKSYKEMLALIKKSDIAFLVTSGKPFESTTKIYDYMAMKIPVMIISSGVLKTGSLASETHDYPTYWLKNDVADIQEQLKLILKNGKVEVTRQAKCSRFEGLKKLYELAN